MSWMNYRSVCAAESGQNDAGRRQTRQIQEQSEQIQELQEKIRVTSASNQAKLNEKDGLIRSREEELSVLQKRLTSLQSGDHAEVRNKNDRIQELESEIRRKESSIADQQKQITSLKSRIGAIETPSKKDGLIRQQTDHIRALEQQLQKLAQDKDVELDTLEQQLDASERDNAILRQRAESSGS